MILHKGQHSYKTTGIQYFASGHITHTALTHCKHRGLKLSDNAPCNSPLSLSQLLQAVPLSVCRFLHLGLQLLLPTGDLLLLQHDLLRPLNHLDLHLLLFNTLLRLRYLAKEDTAQCSTVLSWF